MRRRFVFLPVQRLAPAVPAVVVACRRRNVTRRIGAGTALRSAKYPIEEVVATTAAVASAATGLARESLSEARRSVEALRPEPLEEIEKLEQLRVLAIGRCIQVGIVEHASRGVDTAADYQRFVETYRNRTAAAALIRRPASFPLPRKRPVFRV